MIEGDCVALYARVSSDGQARDNTIASQIAALQERVAADGFRVLPDHAYVDEGYSGTILLRPALEKLRDAVAAGIVTRIYIHAPDRLVRRYAHQILLIEEFHRVGAEVIFLNHSIGGTAEDDLLLQVQGVIAEYERAKILERGRRGRRHAARSGSGSALRSRRGGSSHRPPDFRLDRSGASKHARSLPPFGTNGLPDAAGRCSMVCVDDPRHARQSSLYRSRGLRPGSLRPASSPAAADPRASSAFAASHPTHPGASRGMDRDPRSGSGRSSDVRGRSRATRRKPQAQARQEDPLRLVVAGVGRMLWLWLRLLRQGGSSLAEGAFEETALLSMQWFRGISIWRLAAVRQSIGARRPARRDCLGRGESVAGRPVSGGR